ncbi:peptidase [Rhizobium sp. Leaf384]|uniref:DUF922 domain-containing Zn-dependent protease n=1 Tax=unclassified Rhizobium TaxID=2613769 RepID=UPI000713F71F|nr:MULTISPECIES: DUF922 domain-containing protein [unclassified Rhizobium]KQR68777.1 peptidase [Rhizobium sp. Leaf341]KQS79188.1 peptidase [Rhizobium sp. Leaf384]KQS82756.1 peptidase [Rhizobium sp. Leaf383]
MNTARKYLLVPLAALVMLSEPLSAGAETVMNKTITYFAVGGHTAAELDAALSSQGPQMRETGARHPGATRIKFGGTVSYVRRGRLCAVGSARVTLNTKLILPRWTNRNKAGRDLALVWDTLSSDIKRHEERHAEIARNHARDMEKALLSLQPEADCERMQARVARVSEDAIAAHDKDQAAFDRREAVNFDVRMVRLLQYRLERLKKAGSERR